MKRKPFKPSDHGLNLAPAEFRSLVSKMFEQAAGEHFCLTVDELLLNPQQAVAFCAGVRRDLFAPTLADHEILRTLLNHRKNKQARA